MNRNQKEKTPLAGKNKILGNLMDVARVLVACLLCISMVGMMSGCSEDTVSDKQKKKPVKLQVNDCALASGAQGNGSSSYNGKIITVADIEACTDRQQYLDLVCPVFQFYCQKYGIKYPGIPALQGCYEAGLPTNISNVGRSDNNFGGLKFSEGIPNAKPGSLSPASEGSRPYCRFNNVNEYIEAAIWNISQGSYYKDAMNNQGTVDDFSFNLCDIWIDGQKNGNVGYHYDLISDYKKYGLSKYEGATLSNGNSANSAQTSSSSSSDQSNLVGEDNEAKIWNYLKAEGFNDIQVASIMGNWMRESGLEPDKVQGDPPKHSDTMSIDGKTGYGLAQWTYITYQQGLHALAEKEGKKDSDMLIQLQYFKSTFADRKENFQKTENSKDIATATRWFNDEYERSADSHDSEGEKKRINFANEIFERHNGQGGTAGTEAKDSELCGGKDGNGTVVPQLGEAAKIEGEDERIKWLYDGNPPKTPEENDKFIEEFDVTILDEKGSKITSKVKMHKKLKTEVQAIFSEMAASGFRVTGTVGLGFDPSRYSDPHGGGGGKYLWSSHAYGTAFDVNPNENYCIYSNGDTVGSFYKPGSDPLSVDDKIIDIWKKHGFYWGGDWTSLKDYMHFTYLNH